MYGSWKSWLSLAIDKFSVIPSMTADEDDVHSVDMDTHVHSIPSSYHEIGHDNQIDKLYMEGYKRDINVYCIWLFWWIGFRWLFLDWIILFITQRFTCGVDLVLFPCLFIYQNITSIHYDCLFYIVYIGIKRMEWWV